jgi:hypothetical protein
MKGTKRKRCGTANGSISGRGTGAVYLARPARHLPRIPSIRRPGPSHRAQHNFTFILNSDSCGNLPGVIVQSESLQAVLL